MTNIRYLIDELNQIIVNASVQQEQSTNVNIRISSNKSSPMIQHQPVQQPMQKQPMTQPQTQLPQIKFIQAEPISVKSSSQHQTGNLIQERGIIDIGNDIHELETKNKFLEMIIEM
ncbi:hypothetical protein M9Y10_031605 [Tritrichomonas musculus]|uniref:Uncharacterized protein n=1 Tax=Tritrichomonas musculus TaxID=1915356 RepID=A0ABR2H287_9EUKA